MYVLQYMYVSTTIYAYIYILYGYVYDNICMYLVQYMHIYTATCEYMYCNTFMLYVLQYMHIYSNV